MAGCVQRPVCVVCLRLHAAPRAAVVSHITFAACRNIDDSAGTYFSPTIACAEFLVAISALLPRPQAVEFCMNTVEWASEQLAVITKKMADLPEVPRYTLYADGSAVPEYRHSVVPNHDTLSAARDEWQPTRRAIASRRCDCSALMGLSLTCFEILQKAALVGARQADTPAALLAPTCKAAENWFAPASQAAIQLLHSRLDFMSNVGTEALPLVTATFRVAIQAFRFAPRTSLIWPLCVCDMASCACNFMPRVVCSSPCRSGWVPHRRPCRSPSPPWVA